MTPLAQAIANDACLPLAKRRFGNLANEIGLFDGLHFFECSAIAQTALVLSEKLVNAAHQKTREMTFLPAPRTWIEWRNDAVDGRKPCYVATILEQDGDCALLSKVIAAHDGKWRILKSMLRLPLRGSDVAVNTVYPKLSRPPEVTKSKWDDYIGCAYQEAVGMLSMINTPRIIVRQQHQPHAGLQRKIAASRGMIGKFPLKAWTELKLEVTPPRDASNDGEHEAHLTGGKAYHFCRCHLRIRLGQLELVSAHWRGDPALGIKQTRYAIVPPKNGVWPRWAA